MFAKVRLWIADGLRSIADFIHEEEFDPEEFEQALAQLSELTAALEGEMEESDTEDEQSEIEQDEGQDSKTSA